MRTSDAITTWEAHGFVCVVRAHQIGEGDWGIHWNGYVCLPKGHPLQSMGSHDIDNIVTIHGGITYKGPPVRLDAPDGEMAIGFDTVHSGDRCSLQPKNKGHFWTKSEVMAETERLAKGLAKYTRSRR